MNARLLQRIYLSWDPSSLVYSIYEYGILWQVVIVNDILLARSWQSLRASLSGFFPFLPRLVLCLRCSDQLHETACVCACSVAQSCLTLCSPMDCSPPGSPVHGISQARILEGGATSISRGSSCLRDQTHISVSPALVTDSLPLSHLGRPCKSLPL